MHPCGGCRPVLLAIDSAISDPSDEIAKPVMVRRLSASTVRMTIGAGAPLDLVNAQTSARARTTVMAACTGWSHRERVAAVPAVTVLIAVRWAKPLSVSAAPNSAALTNRSAGSFSSDLATAAATLAGTDLRSSVTGRASSAMIFMMICWAEFPR